MIDLTEIWAKAMAGRCDAIGWPGLPAVPGTVTVRQPMLPRRSFS